MSLWAFRFLLWYICIMIVQPQHRFAFLMPFRIANICMIIATGLHVAACMTQGRPVIRLGPATRLAFALLGFGMLAQYAGALQTDTSWNSFIDILVKNAYALILVEAMAITVERVWAVYATLGIASLWWIKGGLRMAMGGVTWGVGDHRIMGPASGLVQDPNFLAYMMGVFIPLYLYFFQQSDRKYYQWAFGAAALSAVYIALETGSRTGMLQMMMLIALIAPRYIRRYKVKLVISVLVIMVVILPAVGVKNIERFKRIPATIMAYIQGSPTAELTGADPDSFSAFERRTKNRDTWALIKKYPLFGVGMSPDAALYEKDFWGATGQVHCEILMAGRQMGFIGMAMHVGFLLIPFWLGWRIQKRFVGAWPALSELGWTTKVMAASFAVGGTFLPLPWHPILLVMGGAISALSGIVREPDFGLAPEGAGAPGWEPPAETLPC